MNMCIPENVSRVDLSLATIIRATRIPSRDPNDNDDEEEPRTTCCRAGRC